MTKEEVDLLSKIVLACKCTLGMQAGLLPTLKDECFRQIEDLDKALDTVKATANASGEGRNTRPGKDHMKNKLTRRVSVPSTSLLASVDSVLQWFREKARNEDRRPDAQSYADIQWLIRHDMKANASLERLARSDNTLGGVVGNSGGGQ